MKIMLYKDNLYSQGEILDIFAAEKRVAQLQVVNVFNDGEQNNQNLECNIIQCHNEYAAGLEMFRNVRGYIDVKVKRK